MNVFETHRKIVDDYARYIRSFVNISDPQISAKVEQELGGGKLWPDPLLQFNPAYERVGSIDEIVDREGWHPHLSDVFRGYALYRHQLEAVRLGIKGEDF